MKIYDIKHYGKDHLIDKLKQVTMLEDPEVKVYDDSYISTEIVNVNCLAPPQTYVLYSELRNKIDLKFALSRCHFDIFRLNGYVEFTTEDGIRRTLLPPIVEESIEDDGTIVPLICDGMHRCYLARTEFKKIEIVYIRGTHFKHPYYSYPILGGWDKVDKLISLEKGYIKKWHRIEEDKKLYRNFDSVFSNCSTRRKSTK